VFGRSSQPSPPTAVKIVVSGGCGSAKTTLSQPYRRSNRWSEAAMTEVSRRCRRHAQPAAVSGKTNHSGGLDFGG